MHFPLNFANGWDYHRTINSSWHQRTTKRMTDIRSSTQNSPNPNRITHSMHSKIFLLFIQFQCLQIKPKERKREKNVRTFSRKAERNIIICLMEEPRQLVSTRFFEDRVRVHKTSINGNLRRKSRKCPPI